MEYKASIASVICMAIIYNPNLVISTLTEKGALGEFPVVFFLPSVACLLSVTRVHACGVVLQTRSLRSFWPQFRASSLTVLPVSALWQSVSSCG